MHIMRGLAKEIRPQLDAEQLVWDLLNMDWPNDEWPDVWVESIIDMGTNAHSEIGMVIYADVGSPVQKDRGLWSFPLTLTVMGDGANHPDRLCRLLYESVTAWPFAPTGASHAGHVSRVLSFQGFQRVSEAKENGGKNITEYAADLVVEARDIPTNHTTPRLRRGF